MLVLGLDFETTGLDTETCDIVEVGIAKYDTESHKIFNCGAIVCYSPKYQLDPGAVAVHGFQRDFLERHGVNPRVAFTSLAGLINGVDALCTHSGNNFDIPILKRKLAELNIDCKLPPCIDTRTDLPYPDHMTSRRLVHLAIDHGIIPVHAHSAAFDVVMMLSILSAYDIEAVMNRAVSPMIRVAMEVPFEDNAYAKGKRYRWDTATKVWYKDIREYDFDKEAKESKYTLRKTIPSDSGQKAKGNS